VIIRPDDSPVEREGYDMMRTEYLPFGRPSFGDEEIAAVTRVMKSGWVGMGPETIAFEEELAAFVGVPHIVTVNSCTSALFLSLLVAGVQPGDDVICPSLTWCSSANAALYLGARPVFCDVDPETLCLTPDSVLDRLTPNTRAVVVVHFGGLAVDVATLKAHLPRGVAIVEDAAHALGARFADGTAVGASGNLTCFSFYANKNVSTAEGGAVAAADAALAQRLKSLRQHALPIDAWKRYSHPQALLLSSQLAQLGYKMNFTDLQAAIGRVQLRRLAEFEARRRAIAVRYVNALDGLAPPLTFQKDCTESHHARHLFVVQLPARGTNVNRDEMVLALRARNVGASVHYAPLHTMPLYCGDAKPPSLPVTESLAQSIMTLPISASMSVDDAGYVAEQIAAVMTMRPALVA
jgi:dTDP-4-amino-4,6-dideoxygalactose transaminase